MSSTPPAPGAAPAPDPPAWWHQVVGAALVGTARRPVPSPWAGTAAAPVRARPGARPETALLDAAALGGALLAAGTAGGPATAPAERPGGPTGGAPAASESRPEAPAQATQLLSLILVQNPAGPAALEPLVRRWCAAAHDRGYRVPHTLLPQLLELGRARPGVREGVSLVLGERGRWLAARFPGAGWVTSTRTALPTGRGPASAGQGGLPDLAAWAHLGETERLATLRAAREHDPAAGRALVESTWASDPARTRKAYLEVLESELEDADEELLERALDDRAATVRAVATGLLEGLPRSARARRMADRLRPLLRRERRLLRTHLTVDLPADPDPAGVRDGLGPPPAGGSARAHWLVLLAAGAPLSVWTDATGTDAASTYRVVSSPEAREGIQRAVLRRADREWARAVALAAGEHGGTVDPGVVALLEPAEAERFVLSRADAGSDTLAAVLEATPGRWSRSLSLGLVDRCRRTRASAGSQLPLQRLLARADDLHPDALPALRDWLATDPPEEPARRLLRDLVQHLSLYHAIEEAFAP